MALATLSIDLVAKLGNLEAGFTKAQQLAQKNADQITASFKQTQDAAKFIGAELAKAFSIAAITEFVKGAIDAQDHMNDLAAKTQLTVEEIGGLGFAASQAGSDLDGAALSMGKLNLTIAKAAAGDKAAIEVFQKMGISIRDANGHIKSGITILGEAADSFTTFAEGPTKAALANALFGKGYASMLPLLRDGGAALKDNVEFFRKFGGVTTESAKAADNFNDQIGRIKLVTQGLRNQIVNELVDPLLAVAEAFLKFKTEGEGVPAIVVGIRTVFETILVLGANVAFVIAAIGRDLAGLLAAADAAAQGNWKGAKEVIVQINLDDAEARKTLDAFEARVMRTGTLARLGITPSTAGAGRGLGGFQPPALKEAPPLTSGVPAPPKERIAEIENLIARMRGQVAAEKELTDVHKELHKAEEALASDPKLAKVSSGARLALLGWADAADKAKNKFDEAAEAAIAHDKLLAEGLAETRKKTDEQAEAFRRLIAATPSEQIKVLSAELEELSRQQSAGLITITQWTEAVQLKLGIIPHDFAAEWKQAVADVQATFENQFADSLVKIFQGNTKSILADWASLLQQMVAKALAAKLGAALFGDVSGSGASGLFGSIIKFFSGFSGSVGGGAGSAGAGEAGGGFVAPWSVHPVNERGIEAVRRSGQDVLLVGSKGGRVVPNNMLGGGPVINVNFQLAAGVTRNELAAMIPALTEHVKASVRQSMRRPGYTA